MSTPTWTSPYKRLWLAGLALILAWSAGLTGTGHATEDPDWSRLSQGQVVIRQHIPPSGSIPAVEARILVPQPPEKVWTVVANPQRLMSQERKVKKITMLAQQGNRQQVAFTVAMTRLLPTFDYVLQQDLSPPSQLTFKRLSGSFRDIQGSWRLTPAENGTKTILSYTLKLDPGPLVPRGMLLSAVKADLPVMMNNAKQAILQNH